MKSAINMAWEHGGTDFQSRFDKVTAQAQEMKEGRCGFCETMTVLQAVAILEAAVLESKKRNIDTPEVREALDFLEPHIRPAWLIPQFRGSLERTLQPHVEVAKEGQQQSLRATFTGIRNAVRVLLEVRMDSLARKFHDTHDMKVKDEIYRLSREVIKLDEPWSFRVI
jgi:hypothetical protein